jgi:hypothetical protein
MRKQWEIWFRNTVLSALLLLSFRMNAAFADQLGTAQAEGTTSANQALSLYGTQAGSNAKLSVPMTNSTTPFTTMNGQTSFSANLTSPSSAVFLDILIQPAQSGDLQQMIISQDLNTDGKTDYVYTVPRPISGVCANGYVSCNPGTWSNCTSYQWVSDPTGKISDTCVPVMNLSGCYCINSSCGSSLVWTNSSIILNSLGGGVLAAIQSANFGFTITNVANTAVTIDYYGNVTGNSTTAVSSLNDIVSTPPPSTLENYYTNPTSVGSALNGTVQSMAAIPKSLYSEISNIGSGSLTSCTINRGVSVSTQQDFCYQGPFANELDEIIQHTYLKVDMGTNTSVNDCSCENTLIVDGVGCPPLAATQVTTLPIGVVLLGDYAENFFNRVQLDGWDQCSFHVMAYYDLCTRTSDTFTESINDQCSALENDPNCSLYSETADSVRIVVAGNVTGLSPLPSCRMYTGQAGPIQLCRPWWKKQESYLCQTQPAWNFSNVQTRFNAVVGSTTQSGTSLSYSDTTLGTSGTWTASPGSGTLPSVPPQATCELACQTQTTPGSTQVTVTGNVSELRSDPSAATDYSYKVCVNNVCPLNPGEVIVQDCQCLNAFDQAFEAIQSVRLAGKDIICTSGKLNPIQ